jgi:MFS family permease
LSDRTDRRAVIAGLSSLGVVCTAVGWMFAAHSTAALFAVMLLLGATTMPVYALCIVTAADRAEVPLIQIASGILVVNSFGAIIGPMLAAPLMAAFGGEGFFLFSGCCMALGAAWAWFRVAVADRPRHHEHAFVAVPRTSIVATELAAAELSPATDEVQVFEPRVTSAGE